ncbi:MAG: FMN-binding protein [Candidatus Izemoplasmatales bacterium]|jgi:uncharacterized protein with FMN-binding domain|nr:FMN-binding protein [Candidatus Izemoplasmatales bacterium]
MKKIILWSIGVVIVIGGVFLGLYLNRVSNYREAIEEIIIENEDIASLENGVYPGECDVDFIHVKLEVTILDGVITKIEILEHYNGQGTPAEAIIDDILDQQSLEVDAIAGATNSSLVIKKAVELALKSQPK